MTSVDRDHAHEMVSRERQVKLVEEYFDVEDAEEGPDFSKWEVWTALISYLELQEAFGWEFYQKVFRAYRALDSATKKKLVYASAADRCNMWVNQTSQAANKNLVPYYKAWGMPVSDDVTQALEGLDAWDYGKDWLPSKLNGLE